MEWIGFFGDGVMLFWVTPKLGVTACNGRVNS